MARMAIGYLLRVFESRVREGEVYTRRSVVEITVAVKVTSCDRCW